MPEEKTDLAGAEEQLMRAFRSRMSLRRMSDIFNMTMYQLLKFLTEKGQTLSILNPLQIAQIDEKSIRIRLECDELCTFVGEKGRKRWVWLALEEATGCIVAVPIGSRDEEDAGRLMEKIPPLIREKAIFLTDQYPAYGVVLPVEKHFPQEGRSGTAHIERFNGTLRAYCSRLVRRSYSFSKKIEHLLFHLIIIIHQHKNERLPS